MNGFGNSCWTRAIPAGVLVAAVLFSPRVVADNGYAGAGIATRIVYTDGNYGGDHLRLKAGYRFSRAIAIEAHVLSGGKDGDHDILLGFREWKTGPSYGLFIRPSRALRRGRLEVFGLVGATRMETTYRYLDLGVEDKDRIWSAAVGAGMQYNFASSGLTASVDVLWTYGEGVYPHLFGFATDRHEPVITATLTAGLGYRF